MTTPMMGQAGVIGMAARAAERRQERRKALSAAVQNGLDTALRWVLFPLLKLGVVIVTGILLLVLLLSR